MNRLKEKYQKEVIPSLKEKFGLKNNMAVPRLSRVTINVGISAARRDDKYQEVIERTLTRISGQKPVLTTAKKAISAFKIREGNVVGAKVVLRGNRMYDFVDKLVSVTFPRVKDFRGISPKSVDADGNLTVGFKEHLVFGEIDPDEVETIHGLEVTVSTTAGSREHGLELFTALGFPFKKSNKKN